MFCEKDTEHNMKGLTAICNTCGVEGSTCDDKCLGCHAQRVVFVNKGMMCEYCVKEVAMEDREPEMASI